MELHGWKPTNARTRQQQELETPAADPRVMGRPFERINAAFGIQGLLMPVVVLPIREALGSGTNIPAGPPSPHQVASALSGKNK